MPDDLITRLQVAADDYVTTMAGPDESPAFRDFIFAHGHLFGEVVKAWHAPATLKPMTEAQSRELRAMLENNPPGVLMPLREEPPEIVMREVRRAIAKFPMWPMDPLHALAVLGEEFGELTQAMLQLCYEPHKSSTQRVQEEAVQTAAMALRLVASLHEYVYAPGAQHEQSAEL